jgi:NitT/TauT family transport system substrate-binding protein
MSLRKTVLLATIGALVVITALHLTFNLHVFSGLSGNESFRVGFLPVTCHLTCPVTDFINKQVSGRSEFKPLRFQGWPELKEAFLSGETPATFILAPLAMKLREDGVPLRIVYQFD